MTGPTFTRVMLWKEFRELAGVWIVLAAVGVLWEVYLITGIRVFECESPSPLVLIPPWAAILGGLFLVGCGGAQFAAERENGTYAFLRALPTGAMRVFLVKVGVALTGGLLMTALLVAPMWLMASSSAEGDLQKAFLSVLLYSGIAVEVFFWIVPFSLLGSRPFAAIALGLVCGLILPWAATAFVAGFLDADLAAVVCLRAGFLAIVILVDLRLAGRWFREKPRRSNLFFADSAGDGSYPEVTSAVVWSPEIGPVFMRLVWQQMREALDLLVIVLVALVFYIGVNVGISYLLVGVFGGIAIPALSLLVPVLGAMVFRVDQSKEHYRFLAEHGLSPRLLWTTRQMTGALFVFVILLLMVAVLIPYHWEEIKRLAAVPNASELVEHLCIYALGLFSAYAIGQFCSMAIRSGVIAVCGAIGLSVFAVMIASLLVFFHVNGYLLAAFWIISLFIASFLGTDAWMTGRRTWKTRGRTALVLLIPTLLLLVGTAFHRAYELPLVAVDIRPEQLVPEVTAQERASAERIEAVLERFTDTEGVGVSGRTAEKNRELFQKSLDELLAIHGPAARPWFEPEGMFFTEASRNTAKQIREGLSRYAKVLSSEAYGLELQGKYDEALQCIIAQFRLLKYATRSSGGVFDAGRCGLWRDLHRLAFASDWTPERLLEIRDEVDAIGDIRLSAEGGVYLNYLTNLWELDNSPWSADMERIAATLPWEKERTRRGFRILAAEQLPKAVKYDEMMRDNGLLEQPKSFREALQAKDAYPEFLWSDHVADAVATTHGQIHSREFERRATRLTLTLLAFKRKHGEYPKRLEELVEGGMIEQIPNIVPRGGLDFEYSPDGFEEAARFAMSWNPKPGELESVEWEIPAKTPLLWVPNYVMPEAAYSVNLRPVGPADDTESKGTMSPEEGMEGGMGMGMPGMEPGMGIGPGMGGMGGGMGMGGPPPDASAAMGTPPGEDPWVFMRELLEFQSKLDNERSLLIPLGPVKRLQ